MAAEIGATPAACDGVIVGPGRVGSTLLAELLSAHPEVFCLNETHDLPVLTARFGDAPAPVDELVATLDSIRFTGGVRVHAQNARRAGPGPQEFDRWLAAMVAGGGAIGVADFREALGRWFRKASGKPVLLDKTPDYAHHLPALRARQPDLPVLLMVRDAPAVALSMRRHEGYRRLAAAGVPSWPTLLADGAETGGQAAPDTFQPYLAIWARRISDTMAAMAGAERSLALLRYEDLLAAPGVELARVARFFGVAPAPDWLDHCTGRIEAGAPSAVADLAEAAAAAAAMPEVDRIRRQLGYLPCQLAA